MTAPALDPSALRDAYIEVVRVLDAQPYDGEDNSYVSKVGALQGLATSTDTTWVAAVATMQALRGHVPGVEDQIEVVGYQIAALDAVRSGEPYRGGIDESWQVDHAAGGCGSPLSECDGTCEERAETDLHTEADKLSGLITAAAAPDDARDC